MKFRIGLKARFITFILVLLTAMFGTIAVILLQINTSTLRENLFARSSAFAALATVPIGNAYLTHRDSGTVLIAQQINRFKELDDNISSVAIVDINGKVVYNPSQQAEPITPEQAQTFEPIYLYGPHNVIERIIYPFIETDGRHRYAVAYDISSESVDAATMNLTRSIIIDTVLGLIASAIITYLLVNQLFLKPIKRLRDRAMVISAGNYTVEIPHTRNDEIGDLGRSVNQMAESLKADIHKLKEVDQIKSEFMTIASHNLRTPLTIINGYLEMAKQQALSEELRTMLQSIEINSQRLGIFAEDLLTISSIESGKKVFTTERMAIGALLQTILDEFTILAKDKHVKIHVSLEDANAEIFGSKPHLRGAIWNLLDNALKFTPVNGDIYVNMKRVGDTIQISIKDTGIGIAPEEMKRLFTKFHRGTSTITYNYEGTGIGLYVTKLIIDEHKGSIAVDSTSGKGSTFTVLIPLAKENTSTEENTPMPPRQSSPGPTSKNVRIISS
jgi:signal transduction histidine kinase